MEKVDLFSNRPSLIQFNLWSRKKYQKLGQTKCGTIHFLIFQITITFKVLFGEIIIDENVFRWAAYVQNSEIGTLFKKYLRS